ncbi:PIN domain-containing protein [Lipomyces orientalis]|uniref:PIN domain-containing protein n=1 Tax=Lipomyces orientalis TaxID=1233043 RepID=A0ACC3TWD6_9ASCO
MPEHSDQFDGEELMDLDDEIENIRKLVSHNRISNAHLQLTGLGAQTTTTNTSTTTLTTTPTTTDETDRTVELAPVLYVVDTNFVISHLRILEELVAQHSRFGHLLVFPLTVIHELDLLKTTARSSSPDLPSRYQSDISSLARRANDWLFRSLARSEPGIWGQKANEKVERDILGDDSILDCCKYFQQMRHKAVVLISNDKNLCVRALIYSIRTVSFVPGLTAREILIRSLDLPRVAMLTSQGFTDPVDEMMEDADTSMDIDEPSPDLNSSKHKSRRAVTDHRAKFWFPPPDLKPPDGNENPTPAGTTSSMRGPMSPTLQSDATSAASTSPVSPEGLRASKYSRRS